MRSCYNCRRDIYITRAFEPKAINEDLEWYEREQLQQMIGAAPIY